MALINPTVPTIGQPNSTEDVDVLNTLNTIITLVNGNIDNANVKSGAAILYSKLNLNNGIVNADVNTAAAIAYSKLNLTNSIVAGDLTTDSVTAAKVADNTIGQEETTQALNEKLGITEASTTRRDFQSVSTSENTTSGSFVDLATAGPICTINIPSTTALVSVYAEVDIRINGGAGFGAVDLQMGGVSVSGSATGIMTGPNSSFTTTYSTAQQASGAGTPTKALGTALTFCPGVSGNQNFKLVYCRSGGTSADFRFRHLWVVTNQY